MLTAKPSASSTSRQETGSSTGVEGEAGERVAADHDALAVVVEVAADHPALVGGEILAEAVLDDAPHGLRLGNAHRHRRIAARHAVARAAHRLEMDRVDGERRAADGHVDLQAVAPEDPLVGLDAERFQLGRVQAELLEGHAGMAGHAHEFDLLAVARLVAHHDGDVDAAAVIAGGREFLPVALADHLEEIAVFEGLQRLDVVDFLQADDVGMRVGDGQRGELARVVGVRHRPCLLEQPVFGLVLDLVERQRAVLVELVAEAGEVEPVHQVFDVEGGNAERHGGDLCPSASRKTSWAANRVGRT